MRFYESIKLLAADAKTQLSFLGSVPESTGVSDYTKTNAIFRMAWLYRVSFGVYDSAGGGESFENWLTRTELETFSADDLDTPFWISARHLLTALQLIDQIKKPFLYTAHGLRNAPEWALVRHLALETCQHGQFSLRLEIDSFDELFRGLGDGVIDFAWPDGFSAL